MINDLYPYITSKHCGIGNAGRIHSFSLFLSSMTQRSLTCASSRITVMRLRVNYFKENLGIHDILIHQKSSNLVNSLLLAYAKVLRCGTIWRHDNDDFISSALIGQIDL